MKHSIVLIISILLMVGNVKGQDQVFSIKSENPKLGENISITYNAGAKDALLKDVKEITAYAELVQFNGLATLVEVKMEKKNNLWQGTFVVTDTLAKVILFRFDSGEVTDDNKGNCWSSLIFNSKGDAVEKSHGTMALLTKYGGIAGFPVNADKEKSAAETAMESRMYPPSKAADSPLNKLRQTYSENSSNKEATNKVINDIVKYYNENKSNETAVQGIVALLRGIKQTAKADELAADYMKDHPNGKFAADERLNKVYAENDKQKRIDLIKKLQKETLNQTQDEKDSYEYMLIQALLELKKYDEAYTIVVAMKNQSSTMYNSLAWAAIEKGEIIEKATAWAKTGVDLARNPDPAARPSSLTLKDWRKSNQQSLVFVLDTYAAGLILLGKTIEAEKCYDEVFSLDKTILSVDYYERYVESLNKNNKFEKAANIAEEAMDLGKSSDKLIAEYKTAFVKSKGTQAEFDKKMEAAKLAETKKAREKLAKELVNKPAPQFTLKSLDGKTVSLADLKGKIVVVDFWATWCGPCKASFPTLQKVVDKYKNNKNIVILAVNTWENEKGKEREKTVADFIKENKYTFKVLFDLDDKAQAFVTKFGVEGIPTKFIIDKEGNIQFKTIGFMGEKAMADEMEIQFDMLLKDEHKALLKN